MFWLILTLALPHPTLLPVLLIAVPALSLVALALWLVALSRRLPYAANHDPLDGRGATHPRPAPSALSDDPALD